MRSLTLCVGDEARIKLTRPPFPSMLVSFPLSVFSLSLLGRVAHLPAQQVCNLSWGYCKQYFLLSNTPVCISGGGPPRSSWRVEEAQTHTTARLVMDAGLGGGGGSSNMWVNHALS